MPLTKVSRKAPKKVKKAAATVNFHEFRHGATYGKTLRKFGKTTARKQLIAVALQTSGLGKKRAKKRTKR